MKTFVYLLIGSLLIVSCRKEFIEILPKSTVSIDGVYKTDKDFQDAITAAYNTLQTQYQNFWKFGDLPGEDITEEIPNQAENVSIDQFNANSRLSIIGNSWQNYYRMIYRANVLLAKIEPTDPTVVVNKNRHIGEAKFLRALAYFDLVRIFGDVPMVTTPITVEDTYKTGREKVAKIYDEVIIKDLLDAESKLPASYSGADVGRPTKGAAASLLGRVYLTRKDFVNAEAKLLQVTTMKYALLPNYKDLFDYSKNEHHSEYIFDVEYEEGINEGSGFPLQFFPFAKVIMDYYGFASGTPGNSGSPTETLFKAFDPADPRRAVTVNYGITVNGTFIPIPSQSVQASKSFTTKYIAPSAIPSDSKANWKVIRYADVLLMLAEAMNENGKTAQSLPYLNQVRQRVGLPGYTGLTKDEAREKIYLERRFELTLEGHRWFDLVRTGRALATLQKLGMKENMTVFPLPLTQIQIINDPAILPQNPGYN
ncbi:MULTISPECIES: RagB/SusD family nutrient uptake outer membrane protein [unclassified Spirosoma]|uniref:RagB/SusD family nutrient uptake outer membrane protein n=1 Tax=unclassified Spirosoma TaxID=2621999 RepID=UPI00095C1381|nr:MULTISPECIES: RagB/SusD family nutrient uptake outer membrane protein [unclassified Spirosoma]MBN8824511.1 RagB/SusD family nutrient uptake outer membrane protein [Spirosoma sp.]OJW70881.1 MAG: RagB/SusD family nutrient uptake outer membrane protein [Spirosoma sp. 48-14]